MSTILDLDHKHIWHPCFQMENKPQSLAIVGAEGAELMAEDGKRYWDMVSSWWVNVHGHGHPKIVEAIARQAATLDHVIFANCAHGPASHLASSLAAHLPATPRAFFSDNGSSANEVALKMAFQYWQNVGRPERQKFLCFEGDYHGETVGAMSVSADSLFYAPFRKLLFSNDTLPFPATWMGDTDVEAKEAHALAALDTYLDKHASTTAAMIMEPLLQGASGMNMCRPAFLDQVILRLRAQGVLVIFDEVLTGFGRTGTLFACHQTRHQPDIICLSKGLTGGTLPLAVTLCREEIFESFMGGGVAKAFAHSHSYTANPIACAAACASLELFEEENTLEKISVLQKSLENFATSLPVSLKPRVMGPVMAFDLPMGEGYGSRESTILREFFLNKGLFLRPLGGTIYLMPPYCMPLGALDGIYGVLQEVLGCILEGRGQGCSKHLTVF